MWNRIKKNLFFKILAVFIAIIIWFIVSVNNNPIEVKTLSVPIQIQNERNLSLRNLKIVNDFDNFIDVQVKGVATEVNKVSASDFTAYVDYVEIINESITELTVKGLNYSGNANITYSCKEGDETKAIKVERLISSEFPVTVNFNGEPAEGYELVSYSVIPDIQSVNDVTSMITGISGIQVDIDLDDATQSFTLRKACIVYDRNMHVMNEYTNTITVDVSVIIGKRVNVVSKLTGTANLGGNHMYISDSPEYNCAIIVGDNSIVKDINTVYTKPVDISGKTQSYTTEADLDIPSNLKVYTTDYVLNTGNKVLLNIVIEQLTTREFEFGIEELRIRNKNILKEYTIREEMFKLTLKGRTATLAAITKQQIVPYIDVLDMGDGNGHRNVSILSLGNNVVLSESPALNIYVETIATYSIDSNRILLTNIDTNLIYSIQNETFNMRLVGLSADISDTDISEMKFYVNVQDLREGVHMVDVIVKDVNLPENVRFYEDMQVAVEITAP